MSAVHASEVGLSSADDADILSWCLSNQAVAVTLDADFHARIALSRGTGPSAIRMRIQGLKGPDVARILLGIVQAHATELETGALLTVQKHGVRLRRLPITRTPS